ncbi:hypothetical protein [Nocardia transvalensis]|uniref:hypothetical protein n=1 Tax=Nocardia transvalensis TaxID=37333 RepID=UPI001894ACCF|nr:hypothetical protein [Nocardia transvalensis]MBF6333416.1 hypothetical protein [Nocardia transvalensis]
MNLGVIAVALVAITSAIAAALRHTRRDVVQSQALTLTYAAFAGYLLVRLAALPIPDELPIDLVLSWCGEMLGLIGGCALTVHVATGLQSMRLVRAASFSFIALAGSSVAAYVALGDGAHELLRVLYAMCIAALLTIIGIAIIGWVTYGRRQSVTDALWGLVGLLFIAMGLIGFTFPKVGYPENHPIGWVLGVATIFLMGLTGIANHFKATRTQRKPIPVKTAA